MPETKGLTLEEMDEVFGDSTGLAASDEERSIAIQKRLGLFGEDEKASKNSEEAHMDAKME